MATAIPGFAAPIGSRKRFGLVITYNVGGQSPLPVAPRQTLPLGGRRLLLPLLSALSALPAFPSSPVAISYVCRPEHVRADGGLFRRRFFHC
jgi:hypothetical protein